MRTHAAPVECGLVHLDGGAVEFDCTHQRTEADGHPAFLPCIAEHEQVGRNRVTEQGGAELGCINQFRLVAFQCGAHGIDDLLRRELHVRLGREGAGHRLVGVEDDVGAIGANLRQRPIIVDHDHVAAEHQIGLTGGNTHGVDVFRILRDAQMAGDRATLLRKAGLVEHGAALAFQMSGHANQRADGDDAGAADAGDEDVPGALEVRGKPRHWQAVEIDCAGSDLPGLLQPAAVHGDEAGAETFDAGIILVAAGLVDLALAAIFGGFRQYRNAERFLAAVAAAFADQGVDEDTLLRILELAALASTALLGGAGLVVDQDRHAGHFAHALLHRIELVAMDEFDADREDLGLRPFLDIVGDDDDRLHAFGTHLMRDVGHGQRAVDRLATGHGDGIVVEDLVGDVDLGRDRLANGQRTGVEIGAVAEVLEHVFRFGERRLPAPGRAFATHVRKRVGAAVHPGHHVVAADAAVRARTFRYCRRGVVRATRAVVRGAREIRARQGQLLFLGLDPGHARADRLAAEEARQAPGDD